MNLDQKTVELDNLLRNINTLLNKYTKGKLCKYNLTFAQFHTLWMIIKLEPANMTRLYNKMMVSRSTLTVTVDHLVEKGFVERKRKEKDRRVVLLEVTDQGKKQLKKLLNERQNFFQKSLHNINSKNQKQAIVLLETTLNNLKELYN